MNDTVDRTTYDDDLFIRMDQVFDVPVLSQALWRLTAPLTDDELVRIGARLARTPISRLLRDQRLPLSRQHWVAAGSDGGNAIMDDPIEPSAVLEWVERAAAIRFDIRHGPVWQLRTAPLTDGGAVVSLCSSHAVGDGYLGGTSMLSCVGDDDAVLDYRPGRPGLVDDLRDAAGQALTIGANVAGLARGMIEKRLAGDATGAPGRPGEPTPITSRSVPAAPPVSEEERAREVPVPTPLSIVDIPSRQWAEVHTAAGGTSNSLFIAIVVGLIVDAGRATWDDVVRVAVPMSIRTDGDTRANSTTGLTVDIPAAWSRDHDLAAVRERAKQSYTGVATPSALVRLQPLMQALGDSVVKKLSANAATPLALASSGGRVDPMFAGLGDPGRIGAVASRATTQGVSRERLRRLRGGLAAWFNEAGDTVTLAVSGLDPAAFPTSADLLAGIEKECARWSLSTTSW